MADALAEDLPTSSGTLLDVVYEPWPTPLASAWSAGGGAIASGLDMLLHQAVVQVRLMTGQEPSIGPMRSALLAADLVVIPAQPSPFDGWASGETLKLIDEARIFRPQLAARFVLNRCAARTVIARETAESLADHQPPVLKVTIGQRVVFADSARTGRLVADLDTNSPAAREIAALAAEIARIGR